MFLNLLIFSFLALAVYSRCPSAYEALCNLNILQLPCSKVLKRVLKEGSEKPGVDEEYMRQQHEKFCQYKKQREAGGFPQPLGLGILMWDEVKVGRTSLTIISMSNFCL